MFKRKPRIDENIYGRLMTSFARVVDEDAFIARPAAALAEKVIAENESLVGNIDGRLYSGAELYHLRLLAGAWIVVNEGAVPRATAEVFEEAVSWKFGPLVKGAGILSRRVSELTRGDSPTAAALSDPDAPPLAKEQLQAMIPMRDLPARVRELRGRPKSENTKLLVSVRFSPEVVSYFRSTGDGWQSRMDGLLRQYVASQSSQA